MISNPASEPVMFDAKTTEQVMVGLSQSGLAALLHQSQVDALKLANHTRQVQWYVTGHHVCGFQAIFDHLCKRLAICIDDFAVRATALEGHRTGALPAEGGAPILSKNPLDSLGSLTEYPLESDSRSQMDSLVNHFSEFTKQMQSAILLAKRLGHQELSDFYTGLGHAMDKATWMLTVLTESSATSDRRQAYPL